jgi:hypothetical protein
MLKTALLTVLLPVLLVLWTNSPLTPPVYSRQHVPAKSSVGSEESQVGKVQDCSFKDLN